MALTVNSNLSASQAQRQFEFGQNGLRTAVARLSSGLRINGAADDAAGLAIAERMTTQIRGAQQAVRNTNEAVSMMQTAEGALSSVVDNLQRVRELALQAANSTLGATDRAALQTEATQLLDEVDRIASQTSFNGQNLLDGSFLARQVQVGSERQQTVSLDALGDVHSAVLGQYWLGVYPRYPTAGVSGNLTITLNGPTSQTYDLGTVSSDTQVIVDTILHANIPDLSAEADYQGTGISSITQTSTGAVSGAATYTINGVPIALSYVAGGGRANRDSAMAAINAQSAATGFKAVENGAGITLLRIYDGRTLVASYSAGSATGSVSTDFGLATTTGNTAQLWVTYQKASGTPYTSFTITGPGIGSTTHTNRQTGNSLRSGLNFSTASAASGFTAAVDFALESVNQYRSTVGAMQNRLQTAMVNTQAGSDNASAARSRVLDADFASETAALSRAQILQQAATAMMAQANQTPSRVVEALLKM